MRGYWKNQGDRGASSASTAILPPAYGQDEHTFPISGPWLDTGVGYDVTIAGVECHCEVYTKHVGYSRPYACTLVRDRALNIIGDAQEYAWRYVFDLFIGYLTPRDFTNWGQIPQEYVDSLWHDFLTTGGLATNKLNGRYVGVGTAEKTITGQDALIGSGGPLYLEYLDRNTWLMATNSNQYIPPDGSVETRLHGWNAPCDSMISMAGNHYGEAVIGPSKIYFSNTIVRVSNVIGAISVFYDSRGYLNYPYSTRYFVRGYMEYDGIL